MMTFAYMYLQEYLCVAHTCMCTHLYVYVNAHTRAYEHTYMHAYIYTVCKDGSTCEHGFECKSQFSAVLTGGHSNRYTMSSSLAVYLDIAPSKMSLKMKDIIPAMSP